MPLTIEDGSNVSGANSYVTVAEVKEYNLDRGVTISGTDDAITTQILKATDYLEAQRKRYQGIKTNNPQALQFPRTGLYIDNYEVASDAIPDLLKNAQCYLVYLIQSGIDLFPTSTGQFVVSEKVGPISTTYSEKIGVTGQPNLPGLDVMLEPLFSSNGAFLVTERA